MHNSFRNHWSPLPEKYNKRSDHKSRTTDTNKGFIILFYSILFYSILFYSILFYSILFYSILFYFILFYFILFYFILFYFILFYFILFYFILFYFILFYFILFYFILFYSILFYSILFYSILKYSIIFYSILFYSILFYSILFYSILFYSILFYSILFYSILVYSILLYIVFGVQTYSVSGVYFIPHLLYCKIRSFQWCRHLDKPSMSGNDDGNEHPPHCRPRSWTATVFGHHRAYICQRRTVGQNATKLLIFNIFCKITKDNTLVYDVYAIFSFEINQKYGNFHLKVGTWFNFSSKVGLWTLSANSW